VWVNGRAARVVAANFAEWKIVLEGVAAGPVRLEAGARDAAGNLEATPMVVTVP
jgi:hypothetical protein